MIKLTRWLSLVLALVMIAVACGSDAAETTAAPVEAEPTEAPTTVPTEVPTTEPLPDPTELPAEPEPEPKAEPEPEAEPEPTATVTAEPVAAPAVANPDYLGSYSLVAEAYDTMVTVTVDGTTRTISSNAIPNHETGEFPNAGNPNTISEQDRNWTLTTTPTVTGQARTVRETGVALNGLKFEPGTGESVTCATGENYRIEGLQDAFDLGMDFNNAHVQPTGEYHYHGVSDLLVEAFASEEDLVLVGFAADGHLMYYSKSAAYSTSYTLSGETRTGTDCNYRTGAVELDGTVPDGTYVSDWAYVDGLGDLDECNGTTIGGQYAYLITEAYPYIPRCLMGDFAEAGPGGTGPGGGEPGQTRPGGPTGPPDLDAAAARLGISADELMAALGTPPPDLAAAAETLGITEAELEAALFG